MSGFFKNIDQDYKEGHAYDFNDKLYRYDGNGNWTEIDQLEYLKRKLYEATGVPLDKFWNI